MKPIILVLLFSLLNLLENSSAAYRKYKHNKKQRAFGSNKQFYPWKSRDECGNLSITFGKRGQFPPRGMVGFQGSGNKWLRELIQANTGYLISSVYRLKGHGPVLGYRAFPWEGTTILTRTHDAGFRLSRPLQKSVYAPGGKRALLEDISQLTLKYRGILLIRNPWEAIFSFWQHRKTGSFTKYVKVEALENSAEYAAYFEAASNAWKAVADRWIENTPSVSDLLILKFEDLKSDSKSEMEKVVNFLGLEPNSTRLSCSSKHRLARAWIRKTPAKIYTKLHDVYDNMAPLNQKLSEYIDQINSALERRGFSTRLNYTRPNYQEKARGSIK